MYNGIELAVMSIYNITAYSTFKDCFNDLRSGKRNSDQVSEAKVKEYQELYDRDEYQQAMNFIEYFEDSFTCSGICEQSLFYYTLPMSEGPPTTTCLINLKEKVANNLTYMGLTSIICGIIMLLTWCCQYMLWKEYDD